MAAPNPNPAALDFAEYLPVDNFFDSYVAELENLGPSGVSVQPHDCATGAVPQSAQLSAMLSDANQYQDFMQALEFNLGIEASGASTTTGTAQQPPVQALQNVPPAEGDAAGTLLSLPSFPIDQLMALTAEDRPAGQEQAPSSSLQLDPKSVSQNTAIDLIPFPQPSPVGMSSGYSGALPSDNMMSPPVSHLSGTGVAGASHMASDTQATSGNSQGGTKPKRRRVRTEHQQEQNKAAQQRYRERKKMKATQLENTVQTLANQVEELERIKKVNEGLQDSKCQLESELLQKEAQIKELNEELSARTKAQNVDEEEHSTLNDDSAQTKANFRQRWHAKIEELQNVFDCNGIKTAKVSGEGIPEDVAGTLAMLVEDCVGLVHRVIRAEGVNVTDLVTAHVDSCDHMCDEKTRDVWTRVAKHVDLTPDQQSKAKVLRTEHLNKLEKIYNERQKLNLEAISVLLPANAGGSGGGPSIGKSFKGLFSRTKKNRTMEQVLDSLKENLRQEQRLARELEFIVLSRLLNPIQATWFLLEAYPCFCDSLALLNGVHEVYFEQKYT